MAKERWSEERGREIGDMLTVRRPERMATKDVTDAIMFALWHYSQQEPIATTN